jgi:hypothetical protein
MNLTLAFITAREKPMLNWFFDSLGPQLKGEGVKIIVVDRLAPYPFETVEHPLPHRRVQVKPNIWQGPSRITKQEWWAASAARNTSICLCETEWIACVDDRCVLSPTWLEAVKAAMAGNYAVLGAYEKRINMVVNDGVIVTDGGGGSILSGEDHRLKQHSKLEPVRCPGQWLYGCNFALPLEWALTVNGFEEMLDGQGAEDTMFGIMLQNNGYPLKFDPRMKMTEDRTPSELGTGMRREDKGVSPNDKSHAALARFGRLKRTEHPWDLREIRKTMLAGGQWPSVEAFPKNDWWDGTPISEF